MKQVAELDGRPLVEYALIAAEAAPLARTVVVLGAGADQFAAAVNPHGAEPVVCDRWRAGMAEALKTGINALAELDAAVVLLADQPLIAAAAIERVIVARRAGAVAVRATYDGRPGHPVLLGRELFDAVAALTGDMGARRLLETRAEAVIEVACDDVADPLDVDGPDDLEVAEARVRARRH
jgi:nicotine blue oxidoreductase